MPKLQRDYGDIVTMRYYNFRVFFVSHPDYIEQVLVTDNRKFIKGRILRKNKQLFGNGLLTAKAISGCGNGVSPSRHFTARASRAMRTRW